MRLFLVLNLPVVVKKLMEITHVSKIKDKDLQLI